MGRMMDKEVYAKLIDDDLLELSKLPRSLKRGHIEGVLKQSIVAYYETEPSLRATIAEQWRQIETLKKQVACKHKFEDDGDNLQLVCVHCNYRVAVDLSQKNPVSIDEYMSRAEKQGE